MNNKTFRDLVSQQCGFDQTKQGELKEQQGKAKQGAEPYAVQVCNAGDWPSMDDQQAYWLERDEHLDRTESAALWFDNKAKTELPF